MKRTVCVILFASIIFLTSCKGGRSSDDILKDFCQEYPIDSVIYSSLAYENGEGYIDKEMLLGLYGLDEYPVKEFSLVLYGKVDTVREIGVFITESSEDRIELFEILSRRISFLSSFSDGEGFIRKYKGVIVYGFVMDAAYAESIFDKII